MFSHTGIFTNLKFLNRDLTGKHTSIADGSDTTVFSINAYPLSKDTLYQRWVYQPPTVQCVLYQKPHRQTYLGIGTSRLLK